MKIPAFLLFVALASRLSAQIPVTDVANLVNNKISQLENTAKWVTSIAHLKTQIDQLSQQIGIEGDIREWTGDPKKAAGKLVISSLGAGDLVHEYGQTRQAILSTVAGLDSLKHTAQGTYRAIQNIDLEGNELNRDLQTFRRYAVLDATQANTQQVTAQTKARETELQEAIAETLDDLKSAETDAEVQKHAAKLAVLNGQLAQVETTRRREVDALAMEKIANDSRLEQERLAAAELALKDDFLANQRVTTYMKSLKLRQNEIR